MKHYNLTTVKKSKFTFMTHILKELNNVTRKIKLKTSKRLF